MSNTILGTTLGGRYRLDACIGRGGMSTVYRAYDTVLQREVAIKVMHRDSAADPDQLERFRREARAVAQLSHPHIVTVIDAGEWGRNPPSTRAPHDPPSRGTGGAPPFSRGRQATSGLQASGDQPGIEATTPYIVLEHVAGETLRDLIRREAPLDVTVALAYAIEMARALGEAHDHEIVHRDVKPGNVLLGEEGGAKITDFGIARTLTEEGLTMDGRVIGTTDYVSPEQALGRPVTGQSDIYSLGIVLYEMLTGEVPFKGATPIAVAMMHVREEVPDVQLLRPDVSAATAVVVERATAKDLDRRYPDMASMIADLEEALAIEAARSGQSTGEVTLVLRTLPGPARRMLPLRVRHPVRWVAWIALLAAIVAVALIAAANYTHSGTGVAPGVRSRPGTRPVSLAQTAASSYNPFGTGPEDPRQVSNVVDGDPNTTWSTEHYVGGNLAKPGLGVYLDAAPGVIARAIEIQTPTPGFTALIYGSTGFEAEGTSTGSEGPGGSRWLAALGWTRLSRPKTIGSHTTIAINSARLTFRYYLIWITRLPPESESAEISEVTLFR